MGRLILRSRAVLICVLIACAPAKETIREESTLLAETATVKASGKPPKLTLSSVQTTETGLRFTVQEDKQCIQAKEKKYRVKTIVERKADGVALGYGYGLSALGFGAGVPLLLHGSDTRGAGIAGIAVGAFFLALSVPTSLRAMDSVQNEREDVFETSAGVIVPCGATPAAGLRFNLVVHLAGNQLDPIRIVPLEPADQRGTVVVPLEALAPVFSAGKADPIAFVQSDLGTEVGSVGVGDLLKQWLVVQSEKDFARASSLDTAMAYREFLSRYPDSDRAPQARARYRQRRLNAIEPELRQAIRDQRLDSARNIIAEWKELDPSAISNRDELEQQYAVSMKAHRVGLLEEEIRRSIGRIDAGTTSEFAAALGAAESAVREIAELDGESQRVVRLRSQLSVLRNSAQGRLVTAITRSQPEHVGHLISELVEISGPDGRVAHQARSKYVAGLLAKARSSPTEAATLINWARLLCVGDDCEKARQAEEAHQRLLRSEEAAAEARRAREERKRAAIEEAREERENQRVWTACRTSKLDCPYDHNAICMSETHLSFETCSCAVGMRLTPRCCLCAAKCTRLWDASQRRGVELSEMLSGNARCLATCNKLPGCSIE